MKLPLALLTIAALGAVAHADNAGSGSFLVPNGHGGYNVVQANAPPASIPFFGFNGFAAHVIATSSHEKPKFVLVPVTQDDGHGKHVVYKKVYFWTAEEAEAAKPKLLN